jgi:aspartate dehydrogenase
VPRQTLKVGLAGLGAVGLGVARRLETGIPGLVLAAIAVRDKDKARRHLPDAGSRIPIMPAEALAQLCDIVVECLPPDMFRKVAISAIEAGKIFMPLSVGQLLENWDLVERASWFQPARSLGSMRCVPQPKAQSTRSRWSRASRRTGSKARPI